ASVRAHRRFDGARVLAEALAFREFGQDRPGEVAGDDVTSSRAARFRRGERSADSATCRWTSSRTPSRHSAPGTEYGARLPWPSAPTAPWPGTVTPLRGSGRPSESRAFLLVDRLAERFDFRLERSNSVDELLEGLCHRIRQVDLVHIDAVDPLSVLVCYSARHADHNAVGRHLAHDDGPRADAAIVPNSKAAEDLRAGADGHVVAERRVAFFLLEARPAKRYALQQRHVVADLG